MANRTVQSYQLTPNTFFYVKGKVAFSRVTTRVDGEELRIDQNRRRSKGWVPIEKPYTSMTISNAEVICNDKNHMTPEEIYATESLYTSKSQNAIGFSYTAVNKGIKMPYLAEKKIDENGRPVAVQFIPEGELANGLDVTLIMKVFKGKPNNGVALEGIIVNEPVRYFNTLRDGAGVEELGMAFKPVADTSLPKSEEPITNAQAPQTPDYQDPTVQPFNNNVPAQEEFQPQNPLGANPNYVPPVTPMPQAPQAPTGNEGQPGGICYSPEGTNNRNY